MLHRLHPVSGRAEKTQEGDLNSLRKEVVALQIMQANFEQSKPKSRLLKYKRTWFLMKLNFRFFQIFLDSLFQSFNQQVSMNNFAELSGCVFSWIEEQCKPGDLQVKDFHLFYLIRVDIYGSILPGREFGANCVCILSVKTVLLSP